MSIVMRLKSSDISIHINFKFQKFGIASIFEGLISAEEYYNRIHSIIKLGYYKPFFSNLTVYKETEGYIKVNTSPIISPNSRNIAVWCHFF